MGYLNLFQTYLKPKPEDKEAKYLSLPPISLLNSITHVLLFYNDPTSKMIELLDNSIELHECFCDIYGTSSDVFYYKYKVIAAFPESRSDLMDIAKEYEHKMKEKGVHFVINQVKASDMFSEGKAGILECTRWLTTEVILQNEKPFPLTEAIDILLRAK